MPINLFDVTDSLGGNWWEYIRSHDFAFLSQIPDKAEEFGFKIDGDFINMENADINAFNRFLRNLDP